VIAGHAVSTGRRVSSKSLIKEDYMFRITVATLTLFSLISIPAFGFSVNYDCSVLPGSAIPSWGIIGRANFNLSVKDGILHMVNPDNLSWVLLERVDPEILNATTLCLETRVMVPSGTGQNASPQIAMTSIDPELPYGNRSHIWYAVDLYPDRIEFTLVDNDNPENSKFFGSYSIPDLNVEFHTITLCMSQTESSRDFVVYVDGVSVISVTGEDTDRPINAVDIGYGLEVAVGHSYWDYISYWDEAPIGVESKSWGGIKRMLME